MNKNVDMMSHGNGGHGGITVSGYVQAHRFKFLDRELVEFTHQLASGAAIWLVNLDTEEPGKQVGVYDPLCQMPGSYEVNRYGGTMPSAGSVRLVFDGEDVTSFPKIIDPVTGMPAVVDIQMVNYDISRVFAALGVQPNATVGGKEVQSRKGRTRLGRAGFNRSQQGFSLVRNGRELRNGETLGIYTKHDTSKASKAK